VGFLATERDRTAILPPEQIEVLAHLFPRVLIFYCALQIQDLRGV
jgi:hypothetical protein